MRGAAEVRDLLSKLTPRFIAAVKEECGAGVFSKFLLKKTGGDELLSFNGINSCRESSVILKGLLDEYRKDEFEIVADKTDTMHRFLLGARSDPKEPIIVDGTWKQVLSISATHAMIGVVALKSPDLALRRQANWHLDCPTPVEREIKFQLSLSSEETIFYGTDLELRKKLVALSEERDGIYGIEKPLRQAILSEILSCWEGDFATWKRISKEPESTPSPREAESVSKTPQQGTSLVP